MCSKNWIKINLYMLSLFILFLCIALQYFKIEFFYHFFDLDHWKKYWQEQIFFMLAAIGIMWSIFSFFISNTQ